MMLVLQGDLEECCEPNFNLRKRSCLESFRVSTVRSDFSGSRR